MSRAWTRGVSTNANTFGYYGYVPLGTLAPGQTLLRTLWSLQLHKTYGDFDYFPPGSSICRAGILVTSTTEAGYPQTPISNESANWVDLVTLPPQVDLAVSTDTNWFLQWNTGNTDRNSVVHRLNSTAATQQLLLAWEFQVTTDSASGFGVDGWNCSVDAYINTP